jgi:general secretion pathway protein G
MLMRQRNAAVRGGFTLMEMLVVVAILVILAGAAVPIYMRYLDDAKKGRAKMDVKTIEKACEAYFLKEGQYPASLAVLTQMQPDGSRPYLEADAIFDPWKRPYGYSPTPTHNVVSGKPDVWSEGPSPGNPASQIGNWSTGQHMGDL